MERRVLTLSLLAGAAMAAGSAPAAGQPAPERKGVLAGLPSPPGPTIGKIKALGDNEWLNLGPPAPDPKWGKARGRSWSAKMPYAGDLGGAFLNGQGVHGYIKPDGYFMDDIWFYDLNGHRWICLYPGTDTRSFVENIKKGELKVNDDGQLVDKEGQPVPFSAIAGHSYQAHTYDPDLRKYVFAGGGGGIGNEQHVRDQEWCKKGRELLAQQGKADKVAGAPYYFNTVTGNFERPPLGAGFGGVLFYLPGKKALWAYAGGGVTLLADPATHKRADAGAKGPTPQGIDFGACYDPKRDRIYVGGGSYRGPYGKDEGFVYIYDPKTNAWSNPPNKEHAMRWPGANYCCVHYDAAADRVLCLFGWCMDPKNRGISAYDPEAGAWDAPLPIPAEVVSHCVHGFYSPEVNAHFIYTAGDSDDRGTMWVYRYKRGTLPGSAKEESRR